jgi:hypothetical protein
MITNGLPKEAYLDPENKKHIALLHWILRTAYAGCKFDGIHAARSIREDFGLDVDWHVTSAVMDEMTRMGRAECVQPWGMTVYKINNVSME